MAFNYNDPLIYQLHSGQEGDEYQPKSESYKIINNKILLDQLPVKLNRINIADYFEIDENDTQMPPASNEFSVNYTIGKITFNSSEDGKTVTVNYSSRGAVSYPASKVYTRLNVTGDQVEKTLQDIVDEVDDIIGSVEEIKDLVERGEAVQEDLDLDINTGNTLHDTLQNDISSANLSHTTLQTDIEEANTSKTNLDNSIDSAIGVNSSLDGSIVTGETLKEDLDVAIDLGSTLNTNLEQNISTGTILNDNLVENIDDGTILNNNLESTISDANTSKSNLDGSVSIANTAKTNLDNSTTTANSTKDNLDNSISTGSTLNTNLGTSITTGTSLNNDLEDNIDEAKAINTTLNGSIDGGQNKIEEMDEKISEANTKISETETARQNAQNFVDSSVHLREWISTTAYLKNNEVRYNGSTWRAMRNNSNVAPVEGLDWTLVAQRGIDGTGSVVSVNSKSPDEHGNVQLTPEDIGLASLNWENINYKPTSPVGDIDDAVNKRHEHPNKSILDGTEESFTTAQKNKLSGVDDGANKYVHPSNHPPTIILQDSNNRFVSDIKIAEWDAKETPSGAQTKATSAENNAKNYADSKVSEITDTKGIPDGYASLDETGNVPLSQLGNVEGMEMHGNEWHTVALETPSGAQAKVDALAGVDNTKTVKQVDDARNAHELDKINPHEVTKTQVGLGNVDNVKQMPIAGGTFSGIVVAQNNTSYTTKQVRNITLSTSAPSGGANGDIWFRYE